MIHLGQHTIGLVHSVRLILGTG